MDTTLSLTINPSFLVGVVLRGELRSTMIHNVIPWLKSSPLEGCISNWTQDVIPGFHRAFGGMTGPKYLSCPCWSYILKKRWKIKGNFFQPFCLVSNGRFGWCTWWIEVICVNKGGWYVVYGMYTLYVYIMCTFSIMHTWYGIMIEITFV